MKSNVPVPVLIAIGFLVVAILGFFGYKVASGGGAAPVTSTFDIKKHEKEVAEQSGGDFDKLSAADKKLLDDQSMGHGRNLLKSIFKQTHPGTQ